MLAALKKLRSDLDAIIANAEGVQEPHGFERKPLPADAKPAVHACHALWEAVQVANYRGDPDVPKFNYFDYARGLQPGGGLVNSPEASAEVAAALNSAIIALGFTEWGQRWLNVGANGSQIDPAYQRHFLGFVWKRANQNDETQGYVKVA